jgi:CHASE2 domain-containing sensor protein
MNKKKFFYRDTFLASAVTVLLTWLVFIALEKMPFALSISDPIEHALSDFQYTDLIFSTRHTSLDDPRIVLVNIGQCECYCTGERRRKLIEKINLINSRGPKVIGLDVIFHTQDTSTYKTCPPVDTLFGETLARTANVVSSFVFEYDSKQQIKRIRTSDDVFHLNKMESFANLPGEDDRVARYFMPYAKYNGARYPAFATVLAFKADSAKLSEAFKYRDSLKSMLINYQYRNFEEIQLDSLYEGAAKLDSLRGKIVLLGYLGPDSAHLVLQDRHTTPMNSSFGGHSVPDMYGVEIHSNIISMLLDGKRALIWELPWYLVWLISFIICWGHILLFARFYIELSVFYHLSYKIMQLFSFFLFLGISVLLFVGCNIKLEPSVILLPIVLSVDVLYFFDGFMKWLYKKYKIDSYFRLHHE